MDGRFFVSVEAITSTASTAATFAFPFQFTETNR